MSGSACFAAFLGHWKMFRKKKREVIAGVEFISKCLDNEDLDTDEDEVADEDGTNDDAREELLRSGIGDRLDSSENSCPRDPVFCWLCERRLCESYKLFLLFITDAKDAAWAGAHPSLVGADVVGGAGGACMQQWSRLPGL